LGFRALALTLACGLGHPSSHLPYPKQPHRNRPPVNGNAEPNPRRRRRRRVCRRLQQPHHPGALRRAHPGKDQVRLDRGDDRDQRPPAHGPPRQRREALPRGLGAAGPGSGPREVLGFEGFWGMLGAGVWVARQTAQGGDLVGDGAPFGFENNSPLTNLLTTTTLARPFHPQQDHSTPYTPKQGRTTPQNPPQRGCVTPPFPTRPQVFKGIMEIYQPALNAGTNILAMAPLPAPGFVSRWGVGVWRAAGEAGEAGGGEAGRGEEGGAGGKEKYRNKMQTGVRLPIRGVTISKTQTHKPKLKPANPNRAVQDSNPKPAAPKTPNPTPAALITRRWRGSSCRTSWSRPPPTGTRPTPAAPCFPCSTSASRAP
jgi:hypothetical protein